MSSISKKTKTSQKKKNTETLTSSKQMIYDEAEEERNKQIENILVSLDEKKIIIAGPGTGKSFLFQKICEKNIEYGKNENLTLSFINELVDDLKKDLKDLAKVKTLHSFALSVLKDIWPKLDINRYFLDLEEIIQEDYNIIEGEEIVFKDIFHDLINDEKALSFYTERRKYYNYFSSNCSVYALIKSFEEDENRVPKYSLLLIDEFQDFNLLEISLIDWLSKKSPILIVGDDDQSLYSFKNAKPQNIRDKDSSENYTSFDLSFCSRCTEVIVKAFNSVVIRASEEGFLKDRKKEKDFFYFRCENQDKESEKNPNILIKTKVEQGMVAYNIKQAIEESFPGEEENGRNISVLIICPGTKNNILKDKLEKYLRLQGFKNIQNSKSEAKDNLLYGLELLLKPGNSKCNLGWRIVSKHMLEQKIFDNVVTQSHKTEKSFKSFIDKKNNKYVSSILKTLRKIRDNNQTNEDDLNKVFCFLDIDPKNIAIQKIKSDLEEKRASKNLYKNTSIKITTILGSKGLSSDYVFMVNFDDKFLLDKSKITDEKICNFLVALTRARKRLFIYTSSKQAPKFVEWIGEENCTKI